MYCYVMGMGMETSDSAGLGLDLSLRVRSWIGSLWLGLEEFLDSWRLYGIATGVLSLCTSFD